MAKKSSRKAGNSSFVLFDVFYDDGSRSSNRKVPASEVGGLDGDKPAEAYLEAQDREIAERSGRAKPTIKSVKRSAGK
jgi:hypothetical protein